MIDNESELLLTSSRCPTRLQHVLFLKFYSSTQMFFYGRHSVVSSSDGAPRLTIKGALRSGRSGETMVEDNVAWFHELNA